MTPIGLVAAALAASIGAACLPRRMVRTVGALLVGSLVTVIVAVVLGVAG